ncbi:MAG: arginine--tRNA ligase [Bacteroidales bacterium]|nr:arginine--tRNA ligase [Bacteroidales bacterium]
MNFEHQITTAVIESLQQCYGQSVEEGIVSLQKTKKEFEGDFTLVVFPFLKISKTSPENTAKQIGDKLLEICPLIERYNVIKGFLNLTVKEAEWTGFVEREKDNRFFGHQTAPENAQPVLIEFSSPNTNKPLHLGHVRNNLLGNSVSRILEAAGNTVIKVNLVNDRGIHICKSMIAWKKYGNGETPESTGMKGDHLVGKYYVEFDKHYKEEVDELKKKGLGEEEAAKKAPILLEAQAMLRKWEEGDEETRKLWGMMNGWVYNGFESTYQRMGIAFDKTYYESNTYLLGKEIVKEGLDKKVFYYHTDGSVRIDLRTDGLDEKVLLRSDGTSVYMTQDLGTALTRYREFHPKQMIYVVGNEQNYHFDVLKLILDQKLGYEWGKTIYHLSYGMVELPSGKMKSREGTVVDADDLMEKMVEMAAENSAQLGKTSFSEEEARQLAECVGIGALKYFILKVDPKKNMLFNPDESIDLNGNTAPFIQYTHARIRSLIAKGKERLGNRFLQHNFDGLMDQMEKEIIRQLYEYPSNVAQAAETFSPALIANYTYELAKTYNRFYQECPILKAAETDAPRCAFRLHISQFTADVIRDAMGLLGIDVPDKM